METYEIASASEPGTIRTVTRLDNGLCRCTCPGGVHRRGVACRHIKSVLAGDVRQGRLSPRGSAPLRAGIQTERGDRRDTEIAGAAGEDPGGDEMRSRYELINPSDPYTLLASEDRIAIAAAYFIGEGWYGLTRDGKSIDCIRIGGGPDAELYGMPFSRFVRERSEEIAQCLESVLLGKPGDNRERQRTSLDDIGKRAQILGDLLRRNVDAIADDIETMEQENEATR